MTPLLLILLSNQSPGMDCPCVAAKDMKDPPRITDLSCNALQVAHILESNGVVHFSAPHIDGYGWDKQGELRGGALNRVLIRDGGVARAILSSQLIV